MKISRLQRWWRHVKVGAADACWPWIGGRNADGYGLFEWGGRPRRCVGAHRAGWLLIRGEIPATTLVLHSCDSPPCCNPAHWFTGSHKANTADMLAKGRSVRGRRWGRLSDDQVRAIRVDERHAVVVGLAYGITDAYVRGIWQGRNKAGVSQDGPCSPAPEPAWPAIARRAGLQQR